MKNLAVALLFLPVLVHAQPIHVLIFSGQNNHDWKKTTPALQQILTRTGRFAVDVTERPDQCDATTLAKYDVVLSNWNTWGKGAVTNRIVALLDFVRGGKGFVVVHAGSSSFYDWPEYQQLAGASWKLGVTNHGKPHQFTVKPVAAHSTPRTSNAWKPEFSMNSAE